MFRSLLVKLHKHRLWFIAKRKRPRAAASRQKLRRTRARRASAPQKTKPGASRSARRTPKIRSRKLLSFVSPQLEVYTSRRGLAPEKKKSHAGLRLDELAPAKQLQRGHLPRISGLKLPDDRVAQSTNKDLKLEACVVAGSACCVPVASG